MWILLPHSRILEGSCTAEHRLPTWPFTQPGAPCPGEAGFTGRVRCTEKHRNAGLEPFFGPASVGERDELPSVRTAHLQVGGAGLVSQSCRQALCTLGSLSLSPKETGPITDISSSILSLQYPGTNLATTALLHPGLRLSGPRASR